jgi:hypothetical protein
MYKLDKKFSESSFYTYVRTVRFIYVGVLHIYIFL